MKDDLKFLGLKNDGAMENAMVVNQARIQEELGLDFEKLWKTITEEFHLFFKNKPYSAESLELLSTYFLKLEIIKKWITQRTQS